MPIESKWNTNMSYKSGHNRPRRYLFSHWLVFRVDRGTSNSPHMGGDDKTMPLSRTDSVFPVLEVVTVTRSHTSSRV